MTQHRESSVARQALLPTPANTATCAPGRRHPDDPPRHPHGQLRRLPLALVHEGIRPSRLVGLPDRAAGRFLRMVPFIIYAEKKRRMKRVLTGVRLHPAGLRTVLLVFGHSLAAGGRHGGVLHCLQPARSLVAVGWSSRSSPAGSKGRRWGVYSTTIPSARRWAASSAAGCSSTAG